MRTLLSLLLLFGMLTPALAQGGGGVLRPKRLVHHFDFEERELGNFESLPMHWYVIGRPAQTSDPNFHRQPLHAERIRRTGYPEWAEVQFDQRHALSGEFSLGIRTHGALAGAFLEVGTLPAVPTSDYLVSAYVRTEGTRQAGARLVAYFIDGDGREIRASRVASPIAHDADNWTELTVKLPGEFHDAAWIGLEIEALQPTASPNDPLGDQQVVLRDVGAGVWFDDISVWQLPQVQVATQSPVNMIRAPQQPQLAIEVRDLTGQRLLAEVTAYDHRYRPVAQQRRPIGGGAPMSWRWTPELPRLGWYLVDLAVYEDPAGKPEHPGPIARTLSALLWLPPEPNLHADDRYRFTLVAEDVPEHELALLPQMLELARLDSVVLSVWERQTTLENLAARQSVLDEALRTILTTGRAVTMSLYPLPTELAQSREVETEHPLGMLARDAQAWQSYLAPAAMRQGQRVAHWQLGQAHDAEAFYHDDLAGLLETISGQFRAIAPNPRLMLPWRVDQQRRPDLPTDTPLAMHVPEAVSARHLGAHLAEWNQPPARYWLHLSEPPADEAPHDSRVRDLAERMIFGWEAGAGGLALRRPWTQSVERRPALWPDPLLGTFANVAQRLAGRRVVGRLDLGAGGACLIFDGPRGGMLVPLPHDARPADAVLDMYLGEKPVAIDVWGNRTPLPLQRGRHRVSYADGPIFIEGIDPELALFRASFRVQPSFVESLQSPHVHEVELRNPWGRTISGHLVFTGPDGWSVQPVRHYFSLSPGQAMRLPIEMTFPFAELAGPKWLSARFDFTAEQHYDVEMSAPLELGLRDIEFHPTVALQPGERQGFFDAEVVCIVTNTGTQPRALSIFINLRNHPRQERAIANLLPGQSIVRRFTLNGLSQDDREAPLRVGLRETNGPAVLNRQLDLRQTYANLDQP